MAQKKIDETMARLYWDMGLSDEMIASRLECKQRVVLKWRQKYNLPMNRGNALEKAEVMEMLPKVGDILQREPVFLKADGHNPQVWQGRVIAVNEKRLTYTMKFENGLIETYKAI